MPTLEKEIDRLANFICTHGGVVVLSGAGCSTASGIGDYRDSAGQWKRVAPVQHQDFMSSAKWRARYWARSQVGFPEFQRALPNDAHHALARLEADGYVDGLITQNVDGLHQQAGQQRVIDLHGALRQVICMSCGARTSRAAWQDWLEAHNPFVAEDAYRIAPDGDADLVREDFSRIQTPPCQQCGGILKPDVVFYGDSVPPATVQQAYDWVGQANLLLVVGSSLMVYSSFRFARFAHAQQIPVVAINQGVTRADDLLTQKLVGDCSSILQQLVARCG